MLQKTNNLTSDRLLFWGFCGLFFFLPVATSPAVITGALTLAIWVFSGKVFKDYKKWLCSKWFYAVLLFTLLPWAGLTYTDDLSTGLRFAYKTHYWLFALAITSLSFEEYDAKTLFNSFLAGLSITASGSISQYAGVFPLLKHTPTLLMNHINISLFLVFGILVASFYFKAASTFRQKAYLLGLMALYFLGLSVSTGRSGYLAFILLSPWIFHTIFGKKYLVLAVVSALVVAGLLLWSPTVQDRIRAASDDLKVFNEGKRGTSIGSRLIMWEGAMKIVREHPVMGVGTGGYKNAMARLSGNPQKQHPTQPHNGFVYMAVSFGVAGLVSIIWLFVVYMKKGWQASDGLIRHSILSFGLIFIIGNMTDSQILTFSTAVMFSLLTGLSTWDGKMGEPSGAVGREAMNTLADGKAVQVRCAHRYLF